MTDTLKYAKIIPDKEVNTMNTIRKIDELGRIVLPLDLRNQLDLIDGDSINISVENNQIILTKSDQNCKICCNTENLTLIDGVGYICEFCKTAISNT